MKLILKFEMNHEKTLLGKRTGRLHCRVGGRSFYAESREDMQQQVVDWMTKAAVDPAVALVMVKGTQHVIVQHQNGTDTYTNHREQDGIQSIRNTSMTQMDVLEEANSSVLHLVSSQRELGEPVPDYLTEEQKREIISRDKWQRKYQAAMEACNDPNIAHQVACGFREMPEKCADPVKDEIVRRSGIPENNLIIGRIG